MAGTFVIVAGTVVTVAVAVVKCVSLLLSSVITLAGAVVNVSPGAVIAVAGVIVSAPINFSILDIKQCSIITAKIRRNIYILSYCDCDCDCDCDVLHVICLDFLDLSIKYANF